MLQNWVGVTLGNKSFVASAERGDVWPVEAETLRLARGRNSFGMIAEGLLAGTLIATEMGWQDVRDLQPGDRIVTFDNGMQPLRALRESVLMTGGEQTPRLTWPLHVPSGALGNRSDLTLLPEQAVLIETDVAEDLFGDPFTLVVAGGLEGYKGISRAAPAREMRVYTLEFAGEEIVYANGTTLLHCPRQTARRVTSAEELMGVGATSLYARLPRAQSETLVSLLREAEISPELMRQTVAGQAALLN
jgi:hypothetical protein